MIPKHWSTESGKFDPKQSELGFDTRSNMAINGNLRNAARLHNDEKSLSNGSGDTNGNTSSTSDESQIKKKKKDKEGLLEGEIEDPIKRHQFYKKLKKAGIKKTFAFEDDWETSSVSSQVSRISVGNASYILDLAQQKESRKEDREEEALEEALELYETWLMQGKSDDKNVFLMILHEVKKEHKAKYKKADKRHAALLDAALDEELERREMVKQEEIERLEDEARQKAAAEKKEAETETEAIPETDISTLVSPSGRRKKKWGSSHSRSFHSRISPSRSSSSRQISFYSKHRESKISEIITKQKSFHDDEAHEKDSYDSNDSFDENSGNEYSGNENEDEMLEPAKPSSRISRSSINSTHSKPRFMFKRFGSKRNVAKPPLPRNDHNARRPREDSKGIFTRLRRTLSERQAEQSKEQETSWRLYSHTVTAEEKWWKKINEAKKENILFDQQKAVLDMTTNTAPNERPSSMVQLDFTTRSVPGNSRDNSPASKKSNSNHDRRKSTSSPEISQDATLEKQALLSPQSKNSIKNQDSMESSKELTPEKKKKKKKRERRKSETGGLPSTDSLYDTKKSPKSKQERRGSATGATYMNSDFDAIKSPKPKDKKKKKKSKSLDSNEEYKMGFLGLNDIKEQTSKPKKKKKGKSFRNGNKSEQSLDACDDWDTRSLDARSKSGTKKKSKESNSRSSIERAPRRGSQTASIKLEKKKKRRSQQSSLGSDSDDAIRGLGRSMHQSLAV